MPHFPNSSSITRHVFPNGLTVLIYPMPNVRSVALEGYLRAGALVQQADEPQGLASLCAAMLLRGTQHADFSAIHEALEGSGAELSISADVHTASFGGKALAEDLPLLLRLLSESLIAPSFPPEWVTRLQQQRITSLKYAEQDSRYQVARLFSKALYPPEHPYHHSSFGTLESLPLIHSAALHAFHQRAYRPQGMVLVIVGNVDVAAALDAVAAAFGAWGGDALTIPALPAVSAPSAPTRVQKAIAGKTQVDLMLGTLGPKRRDPEFIPAMLANCVLGAFGMMGRVGQVIREELGLAYYASASVDGGEGPGAWTIAAGVAPENVELALERAQAELERLVREPISAAELADVQGYYAGYLPLRLESNTGIAATLEMMERHQLGLDYLVNYRAMLEAVTPESALQATQRYLHPEALITALAGALD